ncbi:hypothetical protein BRC94_01230 [Halobacteriales archaeon QS_5_70_17]|nr:MAG: hypothetical protein BRC94_01230 [Halobacteriales archaeon QS_5_70_17]
MKSHEHAAVGAVVGAIGVAALRRFSRPVRTVLWAYGLLLSVFIDLDHFLIARAKAGDWSHLRAAVADPVWAFTDQESVFGELTLAFERLLSHTLLGGLLTLGLYLLSPAVAAYTGLVLYFHVLADIAREAELA